MAPYEVDVSISSATRGPPESTKFWRHCQWTAGEREISASRNWTLTSVLLNLAAGALGVLMRACDAMLVAVHMHDMAAILGAVLPGYVLPIWGDHGVGHWARVLENGLRVAESNGADREVVTLFAMFHDVRRVNEDQDDDHGLRGGELARSLRGSLVHLDDARFDLLFEACRLHTDGHTTGDPTLLACWDGDRLDLGRVGITPEPHRLCTDAAREMLAWADARAVGGYEPVDVLKSWGVEARRG